MRKNNKAPGNTPLIEVKSLAKKFHLKGVYVKDESVNPNSTIKDRRNFHIIKEAQRLAVDKLVIITSGSTGNSLIQLAKDTSIKIVCVVNRNLPVRVKRKLHKTAYDVIEIRSLEKKIFRAQDLIALARESADEVIWDVTNGYEEHYHSVVDEILSVIRPDYIVIPIGSGGIYINIQESLEKRGLNTQVIGVGVKNKLNSFADKLARPWTPYAKALEHYEKNEYPIYRLTEGEIKKAYRTFRNVTTCEPSSSIVFGALYKHHFKPTDTVVFINTGKIPI
jgi:cysteine synthase